MVDFSEKYHWKASYGLFNQVINSKKLKVGAEIGVASGGHVESILTSTNVNLLYGIDAYKNRHDYTDDLMNLPQAEFDELYEYTVKRMAHFGNRFKLLRNNSKDAVNDIPLCIDFVYIDADHSYNGVREDLCSWYPKVKVGGVIGGHDYNHPCFPGVTQAVHEFFGRFGWEIHHQGEHVWWVEKQPFNISFFMPAFNCADTVQESVESIMEGNFTEGDELVIVDDGSSDNTVSVLLDLNKKYNSIKIVQHSNNRGGGAARNTAIENCCHHILFCLDSDNLLEYGSIGRLKEFLESTGADVASFQELQYFQHDKNKIDFKWVFKGGLLTVEDHLLSKVVPAASGNYMFTKQSWLRAGGYPEFAGALDAWGFGFRQVMTGAKIHVLPDSFYYHRYGHESYWIRNAEGRTRAISLIALQILLPFSDLIDERYLDYVMSRKGRYTWFSNLRNRPICLAKGKKKNRAWDVEHQPDTNTHLLKNTLNRLKQSIRQLLIFLHLFRGERNNKLPFA